MKYDLHMHTYYSKCSNLKPADLIRTAKEKGLNGVAITDHHCISGAIEAKNINKDINFEVIIGEEIKTDCGEVIGLYLKDKIENGEFNHIIEQIKKQNGIAILAHPFAEFRAKAKGEDIFKKVDAIEGINSRSLFKFENLKSQIKARELDKTMTAGSDTHFKSEIGKAYTEFSGNLRDAIRHNKTKIYGHNRWSFFVLLKTFFWKRVFRRFYSSNMRFDARK